MSVYGFTVHLLSDVILPENSATMEIRGVLDYIPGAKFMGIAAGSLYDEHNIKKTVDIFHNGTVRFSDAHPNLNDQYAMPIPLVWYHKKDTSLNDGIYLNHLLTNEEQAKDQFSQARKGYFTVSGEWLECITTNFSLKSAHDKEKRGSKKGQMFGYFSIPKGSMWRFFVEDTSGVYLDEIKDSLVGVKRIGKSRTAQYGQIKIEFDGEIPPFKEIEVEDKIAYFAESNLIFFNDFGETTIQPHPEHHLGLPAGSKILWEHSQIRFRNYQSWNRKRYNRNEDKLIIEKGSVIFCSIPHKIMVTEIRHVGSFLSEGFGRVLINPPFLTSNSSRLGLGLKKIEDNLWIRPIQSDISVDIHYEDAVIQFLHNKMQLDSEEFEIDRLVRKFIKDKGKKFTKIKNSQWGLVRNYAKHAENHDSLYKLLFEDGIGCLKRGQTEKDWRGEAINTLEGFLFGIGAQKYVPEHLVLDVTVKLASEMSKQ